jgi:hypothetical protein
VLVLIGGMLPILMDVSVCLVFSVIRLFLG